MYTYQKTSTQIQSILLGELKRKYIKGINEEHLKNILERGRASVLNVIPANNLDTKTVENFQLNFFKFPVKQNVNNIFKWRGVKDNRDEVNIIIRDQYMDQKHTKKNVSNLKSLMMRTVSRLKFKYIFIVIPFK